MSWLAEVPNVVVAAHIRMMDQIQAEETSMSLNVSAASRFVKSGEWVRNFVSRLSRSARGQVKKKQARQVDLAALGIGRVKRDR